MAAEEFDLAGIQALKLKDHLKTSCKPVQVTKSKFVLLLDKIIVGGRPNMFLPIFFKKPTDAQKAFKKLKKDGLHLLKHTALAKMSVEGDLVTLDVLKGALALDTIQAKGQKLFNSDIGGLNLKVVGAKETSSNSSETSTDDKTKKEEKKDEKAQVKAAKRAKRAEKHDKMLEGVKKLDSVKGKAPKETMDKNIQKYETALAALIEEAKADGVIDAEEQAKIDELTNALNDLKAAIAEGGGKKTRKLTTKERETIVSNMDKMDQKLQQILAKLG